jgi:hypothetical protein
VAKYEVGQEVVIHDRNERRLGGPWKGIVTKVGRTLLTVEAAADYGRVYKYRMDDQQEAGGYGSRWFSTLEQEAARAQEAEDRATLAEHGFQLDMHARPTDAALHMVAELLRSVPDV